MKYLSPFVLGVAACTPVPDPHSEAAHGRKVMALQEKFDRFDYNADGKITRKEAEQGIRESGVSGVTKEEIDAMMEHYDVDKDDAISRWESQRAIDIPVPEHD
ncbi:EF-hand domain-containing protein [Haloferula chungangensis]|uniref:EF-hand domain-containing protein n=1 Tax=Haloferula chungangensis TaxID=1048331 RepID=A0ABW2L520_9BACT